jgi:hypothetical protein
VGASSRSAGPACIHVAYEVTDLRATLAELAESRADLIDSSPREGLFGLEVAFVHPDSVHGVLSEVVSVASPERVRIEIAFDGGQIMGALVSPASADALEQAWGCRRRPRRRRRGRPLARRRGRPLHDRASAVVYVKRFARESRVGLGLRPRVSRFAARGQFEVDGGFQRIDPRTSAGSSRARRTGDRDALESCYLLHFDRIYSYLHMSVGNRHDAEDLTTQTF